VREAAFNVEYPRPMFRDAPTVAAVNLVFRPRTPERASPTPQPFDRQIDLILGPVTFDPQKLLESEPVRAVRQERPRRLTQLDLARTADYKATFFQEVCIPCR